MHGKGTSRERTHSSGGDTGGKSSDPKLTRRRSSVMRSIRKEDKIRVLLYKTRLIRERSVFARKSVGCERKMKQQGCIRPRKKKGHGTNIP